MVERFILRQDSLVNIYLPMTAPYLRLTRKNRVRFIQILYIENILPIPASAGFKVRSAVDRPI